jgi:protein TonB
MAKNRPTHVSRPVYPGGLTAMKQFVADNLVYPEAAKEAKIEGTVKVRYTLNYTGKVTDVKIKAGLGHGCDEEAIRVVKLMRFAVPQSNKKKVRIHQDLSIHFKLPKAKKKVVAKPITPAPPSGRSLTINYTSTGGSVAGRVTGATGAKKDSGGDGSYSYSIKW